MYLGLPNFALICLVLHVAGVFCTLNLDKLVEEAGEKNDLLQSLLRLLLTKDGHHNLNVANSFLRIPVKRSVQDNLPRDALERRSRSVVQIARGKTPQGTFYLTDGEQSLDEGDNSEGSSAASPSPYMKTICKKLPGRIVCKSGRYTFVINNGDYELEPKTVANFVGLLYKRVQQGDRSFVVSVQEVPTTITSGEVQFGGRMYRGCGNSYDDELPVTVECDPVSTENVTMCNPYEEPWEIVFECRWHLLGLKRRRAAKDSNVGLKFPSPRLPPLSVRNYNETCPSTVAGALCPTPEPTPRLPPTPSTCPPPTTIRCPLTSCTPPCPPTCATHPTTCPPTCYPQL